MRAGSCASATSQFPDVVPNNATTFMGDYSGIAAIPGGVRLRLIGALRKVLGAP